MSVYIKRTGLLGILMSCLFLIACATPPPVQEFSSTANPTREIENLERGLEKAKAEQVDVLSPDNYARAKEALEDAKDARNDNESNSDVLKEVALGNAWLMQAMDVARQGSNAIPDIVDVRARALESKAPEHAKEQLKKADKVLADLGEDFEDGDYSVDNKKRDALLARYMDIELASIKAEKLGKASDNIKQAEKEGARKIAPQTLALAKKRYKDAEAFITANRQDPNGIATMTNQAFQESERVLRITRESKINKNKTPEQLALEMEREQQAQRQLASELDTARTELGVTDSALAVMSAQNSDLSTQVELDEKIKNAKAQFDENEAEVLRDGDKILIRLKGLKFPSGQADLAAASYPLMTKVQSVIKSLGNSEIEVEGHTDATGSRDVNARLSELRADAVKNYLVQNGAVEDSNVSSAGYADQKPISSNKTKEGRAQNRRVDVILTPM